MINEENIHPNKRAEHRNTEDKYRRLRNILNTIFMLGALTGLCFYFLWNKEIGTYIILVAIGFKFIECGMRLIK